MQRQADQPSPEASAQQGELATVSKKIVDLEAKIARVEATTPLDTVLYAAMLNALAPLRTKRNQLRETAKGAAFAGHAIVIIHDKRHTQPNNMCKYLHGVAHATLSGISA